MELIKQVVGQKSKLQSVAIYLNIITTVFVDTRL